MYQHSSDFYLDKDEPNKSCLLALRSIILEQDETISEALKYGMPCFIYHKKPLCYLWIDKKTSQPYILMVDGKQLQHPALEEGDRTRMKILRVNPTADIKIKVIQTVLKEGMDFVKQKG